MEQFDERGEDRLGAVERQRDMPAIRELTEHDAADRDRIDSAVQIAHTAQQRSQHRQQRHPLAIDLDAEVERKPPPACLARGGLPIPAAIDDARPELRLDLDALAVLLQRGYGVID